MGCGTHDDQRGPSPPYTMGHGMVTHRQPQLAPVPSSSGGWIFPKCPIRFGGLTLTLMHHRRRSPIAALCQGPSGQEPFAQGSRGLQGDQQRLRRKCAIGSDATCVFVMGLCEAVVFFSSTFLSNLLLGGFRHAPLPIYSSQVLCDPSKRRVYDQTGEENPNAARQQVRWDSMGGRREEGEINLHPS